MGAGGRGLRARQSRGGKPGRCCEEFGRCSGGSWGARGGFTGGRRGQVRGRVAAGPGGMQGRGQTRPGPLRALRLRRDTEGPAVCGHRGRCRGVGHQRGHRLHVSAALRMPPFSRSWAPGCCLWCHQEGHWHRGLSVRGQSSPSLQRHPVGCSLVVAVPTANSLSGGPRLYRSDLPWALAGWAGSWLSRWLVEDASTWALPSSPDCSWARP